MSDTHFEPGAAIRFIGAAPSHLGATVALFGAGYDGTASFRPGTRFGPAAIRAASDGIETYSPRLDADLEDLVYADVGDLPLSFGAPRPQIDLVREACESLLSADVIPFMMGGEHSLTGGAFAAVNARHPNAIVVQIDAHADLREHYLGEPDSHACVMRRCVELGAELVQVGVRSGPREEWAWIRAHDTLCEIAELPARLARFADRPIYITLDIDAFDPSLVPGTGTPEPGGLSWTDFEHIIDALRPHGAQIVGLDVMEVSPALDPSGVSAVVGARAIREMLLLLA